MKNIISYLPLCFFIFFVVCITTFIALLWWQGIFLLYGLIALYFCFQSIEFQQYNNKKR